MGVRSSQLHLQMELNRKRYLLLRQSLISFSPPTSYLLRNTVANATGLPTGVTSTFNNNAVTLSGTPNQSGTFNYSLAISGASTSQTVTGTITVNSATATQSYTINVTAQNSANYQLSGNDRNGNCHRK